ncbi:MAG: hypothetical protein NTX17_02490 [Candidatus Eisenbacteria bacterium]|nr:hypothetical protein [Candidatus Eisenbacteria bacterium]
MIHRRTGVAVLAFLALIFMITSCADSVAASSFVRHESWAKHELTSPHRFSGLVFSPTGDPDEIATAICPGGKGLTGETGDLIDAQPAENGWLSGRVAVRSAILRYLVRCFQVVR